MGYHNSRAGDPWVPCPIAGAAILVIGTCIGVILMGEFQDRHQPVLAQDELAQRCLGEAPGFDSYLGWDGSKYFCIVVNKKGGKAKVFPIEKSIVIGGKAND